jgi:hypothetical protein
MVSNPTRLTSAFKFGDESLGVGELLLANSVEPSPALIVTVHQEVLIIKQCPCHATFTDTPERRLV